MGNLSIPYQPGYLLNGPYHYLDVFPFILFLGSHGKDFPGKKGVAAIVEKGGIRVHTAQEYHL